MRVQEDAEMGGRGGVEPIACRRAFAAVVTAVQKWPAGKTAASGGANNPDREGRSAP